MDSICERAQDSGLPLVRAIGDGWKVEPAKSQLGEFPIGARTQFGDDAKPVGSDAAVLLILGGQSFDEQDERRPKSPTDYKSQFSHFILHIRVFLILKKNYLYFIYWYSVSIFRKNCR
jgi:hypothetical protein